MSTQETILFDHAFRIETINDKKYVKVARIEAVSNTNTQEIKLMLDVNVELWPLQEGDLVQLALATSLSIGGGKEDGKAWRHVGAGETTLADEYDYVCHGKIYRFEEGTGDNIKVYTSFGGLLMYLEGPYLLLNPLRIDYVYLLMKK